MKRTLALTSWNQADIVRDGNRFLLGNGHLGYRGCLEEYSASELVGLNLVGVYDRYKDKWRESLNLPNPFFLKAYVDGKEVSVFTESPLSFHMELDIEKAVFSRYSEFSSYSIESIRFLSHKDSSLLCSRIRILPKNGQTLTLRFGMDESIYEINGPHYVEKTFVNDGATISFAGKTNEGTLLREVALYQVDGASIASNSLLEVSSSSPVEIAIVSRVVEEGEEMPPFPSFDDAYFEHLARFGEKLQKAYTHIEGDEELDFALAYSVYHLLILGDEERARSIPARGVSGTTYKGAIFWDTEIFMAPFFRFVDPKVARRLIEYRLNTLPGALAKAKEFGYEGAFFAWESQEDGLEACSKFNISDPDTGEPIRTYFNEKQIHISGDIALSLDQYLKSTADYEILQQGGLTLLLQIARFFHSYAKKEGDGLYHINDVIGPDEYHERIDDNAFTNYLAAEAVEIALTYASLYPSYLKEEEKTWLAPLKEFKANLFLPLPNEKGIIEQFRGYFALEDVTVEQFRPRITNPKEYWGHKAKSTRLIKQADVVALLCLLPHRFNEGVKKANFEFYLPYTEHGSSLSTSMHSLLGYAIGNKEYAYPLFRHSAFLDYTGHSKEFAGGIYIGGSHPAAAGGAYQCFVYGMMGLTIEKEGFSLHPYFPEGIKKAQFRFIHLGKEYLATATSDGTSSIKEVTQ